MYDENLMDRIRLRVAAMPQGHMLCDQVLKLDGVEQNDLIEHAKLLMDLGQIDARIVGGSERRTVFVRKLSQEGWAALLKLRSPELSQLERMRTSTDSTAPDHR